MSSVQVYKQKVKHLLYEHQNSVSTLKADAELGLKLAGEEAARQEAQLQKVCRNLKEQVRILVTWLQAHSHMVMVLHSTLLVHFANQKQGEACLLPT